MFQPAPLFSSHSVLPMGKELRVFGDADPGAVVSAALADAQGVLLSCGETTAQENGFLCLLPAVEAPQTGCTLTISCCGETVVCEDTAIGLVFLAGGQSNMELVLWNADEGQTLIAAHHDPDLRYFNVPKQSLWNDAAIAAERDSHWQVIAPGVGSDMSAVTYFFAAKVRKRLNIPVGIIDCYWGGTSVTAWLDEEALYRTAEGQRYLAEYAEKVGDKTLAQWQTEEDAFQHDMTVWNGKVAELKAADPGMAWEEIERQAGKCPWNPPVGLGSPYRPGGLAETMLKRITPVALTAMLYYQGEEDTYRTACYDQLLMSMVTRWRELFLDEMLPFLNMQLPMYAENGAVEDGLWAALRQAQQKSANLMANSRLACIIDCGEFGNIHPTDKRTPGERLADEYLAMIGDAEAEAALCPRVIRKEAHPGKLVLTADQPLQVKGDEADLFELAEADGVFHPADASVRGACIVLTVPGMQRPVMARYAWVGYAKVHVFGENGAPLRPFLMQ